MGRVKSELMTDGPDDDLIPLSQTVDNVRNAIEDCELPMGSLERFELMKTQLKELMDGIRTNTN